MKLRGRLKPGITRSWMVSYIAILLIPLTITAVLFFGVEQVFNTKIYSMNRTILSYIKGNLDTVFDSVRKIALQVELSGEVHNALSMGDTMSADDHYAVHLLSKRLKEYTVYSDYIDEIVIYLEPSGYYVTSNASYPPNIRIAPLHGQYGLSEENWAALMAVRRRDFYAMVSGDGGRMVYAAPLPPLPTVAGKGVIVVIPKERFFRQTVDVMADAASKAIFLVGGEGEALPLGEAPDWFTGVMPEDAVWSDGEVRLVGEREVLVSSLSSDSIDSSYVILDNYGDMYKELRLIRLMLLVCILFCALLGTGLALYFTWRNYTPVRTLVNSVSGRMGMKKDENVDEYLFLSEAMHSAIATKQDAERHTALFRLLRGYGDSDHGLPASGSFAVAVYAVEDMAEFYGGETYRGDRGRLVMFLIDNYSKDVFGDYGEFWLLEQDRYIVQVFSFGRGEKSMRHEQLAALLEEAHAFFNDKLHIRLSIGLGGFCSAPEELGTTYLHAQEAMEYRMVLGNNVVIDSAQLTDFSLFYDYPIEVERDIIHSLKGGNYQQTRKLIFGVIDSNISSGMLSAQLARCIFFDITGTVIKALSSTKLDNSFLVRLAPIDRLVQCETLPQMKQELDDILSAVCTYINSGKTDAGALLFGEISRYMDESYMDANLNVSALAQRFSVSTGFLVKLFKENAGMNPLDYINRMRIEHALQPLIDTGITVEEVAHRVGFGSVHTFIRLFKKFYGMTPGAYREMTARRNPEPGETGEK
ncbi:helix-turn-helix transcriptional regulator [Ruminococcaceae bacterium OttesenSCG-928-L11]|nr:helix-turn-helix transcriptional regulator [Ruminococcaceae bacterium OttesenSCG-928-L11]